ncbi:MAG TPA: hypothetical protein VE596_16245 [Gaiellaceae bacterium]|nr:hypothetical protein [Gaiellaceae bacterium]
MTGTRHFLATLALFGAIACAFASPASAWYQRYVTSALWYAGSSANSAWNSHTFNAVGFTACCGGSPYMGTKYGRTDGTSTSWMWSNTGSIFDSRTIAYGTAYCGASGANLYPVRVDFCDTGNT